MAAPRRKAPPKAGASQNRPPRTDEDASMGYNPPPPVNIARLAYGACIQVKELDDQPGKATLEPAYGGSPVFTVTVEPTGYGQHITASMDRALAHDIVAGLALLDLHRRHGQILESLEYHRDHVTTRQYD